MPVPVSVPGLGRAMPRARLAEWYLPDGAAVGAGDAVYRLECDAVAVEVEAEENGMLRHRLEPGASCGPGDVAGFVLAPGEAAPPALSESRPVSPSGGAEPAPLPPPVPFVPRFVPTAPPLTSDGGTRRPAPAPAPFDGDPSPFAPAPAPAGAVAPQMRLTVRLAEANRLCEQLSREWIRSALAPSLEDVVARAVAMAIGESPLLSHLGESVSLLIIAAGEEANRVATVTAGQPFREAVAARSGAAPCSGRREPRAATVVSFISPGIDDAAPGLETGEPVVVAIGAPRTVASFDGDRVTPDTVATLGLSFDPRWLTIDVAANLLARIRDLVEAPCALLAG